MAAHTQDKTGDKALFALLSKNFNEATKRTGSKALPLGTFKELFLTTRTQFAAGVRA